MRTVLTSVGVTALVGSLAAASPAAAAPATWSETPVASYSFPNGYLSSVTCPADDLCLAIRNSSAGPAVMRWDGTSWSVSHVLGTSSSLEASVACSGPSFCLATAADSHSATAATFNGSRWVAAVAPPDVVLRLSCPSADRCMALTGNPGVYRYDHGTWTALPTVPPQPHGGFYELNGLSCVAMTDCSAVGTSYGPHGQNRSRAAFHWDGSAWTRTGVPAPQDADGHYGSLTSVSCTGPTFCVAIGYYQVSGPHLFDTLVEQWDGTRWTPAALPQLATIYNFPVAIACASSTSCLALGSGTRAGTTSVQRDYALQWDGVQWTQATDPIVPGDSSSHGFTDLSCAPAGACTAVGYANGLGPNPPQVPLAERFASGAWSMQDVPASRAPFDGSSGDVSCVTTSWCMAVGAMRRTGSATDQTYAQRWDGARWHLVDTPFLGDGSGLSNSLASVSCPSRTFCLAVGSQDSRQSGNPLLADLVERWDGATWSVVPAPRPPGSEHRFLVSASCVSSSFCVVLALEGDFRVPTLFTWRSGTWGDALTLDNTAVLNDVSCASRIDCTAVGARFGGTDGRPMIEQWDGTAWTEKVLRPPADSVITLLTSVSCPAAGTCVAVGDRDRGGSFPKPIAWTRSGTRWTRSDPPLPTGASAAYTSAVDCTAADSCVLGGIHYGNTGDFTMLQSYDGTAWTPATGLPANVQVNGVSCGAPQDCVAVGSVQFGPPHAFHGTG